MTDVSSVYEAIDRQHADESATTRRGFVAATAGMLGGMGLLALPGSALAGGKGGKGKGYVGHPDNNPQTILNIAATAEVLATIVNTVAFRRGLGGDDVTQGNIEAAAEHELLHYKYLTSVGGKPLTKRIWVPDVVFASRENLLNTLQVGDQIFVNAYLIATLTFGDLGEGELAAVTAEHMGVEAVHRALARQSLGLLGNDRAFMRFDNREEAPGAPDQGTLGFKVITQAAAKLQAAGFGFGAKGAGPGAFYDFDVVSRDTPRNVEGVNARRVDLPRY
jgi:hypothetical protein